jgi:ketosteroid isomerase-like protein
VSANHSEPQREPRVEGDELQPNSAVDEFFSKMNRDLRRPKPSEEAVAVALHAIQTLAADVALKESHAAEPDKSPGLEPAGPPSGPECPKCGGANPGTNRFCGFCGSLLDKAGVAPGKPAAPPTPFEKHTYHHHHHYHHFPESSSESTSASTESVSSPAAIPPAGLEPAELASAEAALRRLMQRWTMAYNAKRLDEVTALYSNEAIVLRPSMLPVRGRAGVREHLADATHSGLGDLQLDCTDVGVLGEIACLSGRNRMLMPVAAASRQERTGKFFVVARREGPDWKILADVWCMDMPPAPAPRPPRKASGHDA